MNEAERFLREWQRRAEAPQAEQPHPAPPSGTAGGYVLSGQWEAMSAPSCGAPAGGAAIAPGQTQRVAGFWASWLRYWGTWSLRGRASRSEVWFAMLANLLVMVGRFLFLVIVLRDLGLVIFLGLEGILALVGAFPGICLLVRRFHDVGFSGGWIWLGPLFQLVVFFLPSQPFVNRYGPIPNLK